MRAFDAGLGRFIRKRCYAAARMETRDIVDARILVVNDIEEILGAFYELLTGEGYEVLLSGTVFTDVKEIIALQPNLIILDYIFGEEKLGWQMLQLLKMHRETANIPVIICTAATRAVRDIEANLFARGVRIVDKPFDIEELLAIVRHSLRAPQTDLRHTRRSTEPEPPGKSESSDGDDGDDDDNDD